MVKLKDGNVYAVITVLVDTVCVDVGSELKWLDMRDVVCFSTSK
jgi:hypothetical protein